MDLIGDLGYTFVALVISAAIRSSYPQNKKNYNFMV